MFHTEFLHSWKEWFVQYQKNILLLIGIFIVGAVAFESGLLRGRISQSAPLVISIPASAEPIVAVSTTGMNNENQTAVSGVTSEKQTGANCPLVGSRNSNLYHLATCAVAKRIKPENKVCFSSKEDAEKRGYVAGCIK